MKKSLVSLVLTIVVLIVGYVSLDSDVPTKLILLPGVLAEFALASVVSPSTIGIGGLPGLLVVLGASGFAWFTAIFLVAVVGSKFICHSKESGETEKA
jgi:hypothetical protein